MNNLNLECSFRGLSIKFLKLVDTGVRRVWRAIDYEGLGDSGFARYYRGVELGVCWYFGG